MDHQKFQIYTRAIIMNQNNDILLIKKKDDQKIGGGAWLLPGGTIEFDENVEHALIREIKEETNLDVSEIEFVSHKKMILSDIHWLGIYFRCHVKDETRLMNREPEKHETVGFFTERDIPDMKDYMMIQLSYNFSREFFDVMVYDWRQHSMQKYLFPYLENKVHSLIKEHISQIKSIQIIGNYDRSHVVSKEEKNNKLLNYKRPTALLDDDTVYLSCFPGEDYIRHYANLIATYYAIHDIEAPGISYRLPNHNIISETFIKAGLSEIPSCDTIIYGNIDKIGLFEDQEFIHVGDFVYKTGTINKQKILLLGCEFSIWGNSGEYFIHALSKMIEFNTFIYIGKLGVLDKNVEPNAFLATGESSYLYGEQIFWKNIFGNIDSDHLIHASHITCYSVIEESIYNVGKYKKHGKFIDPEIGYMARGCNLCGKNFSYLHLISDNVMIPYEENLSNEGQETIREKRKILFRKIGEILQKVL